MNGASVIGLCSILLKTLNFVFFHLWKGEDLQDVEVSISNNHDLTEEKSSFTMVMK
jgi:hypothetical protein